MIGLFIFSDCRFNSEGDRIHLFPDAQSALDYQVHLLIKSGVVEERDGKWIIDKELLDTKEEVVEAFQDTLGGLEFFHTYDVEDHCCGSR